MIKYLILAGNHKEAFSWAKERKLKPTEWLYIFDLKNLIGCNLDKSTLVMIGTYRARSDMSKILDFLAERGLLF